MKKCNKTIGSKFGQEMCKCKQGFCKDNLPQQKNINIYIEVQVV